MQEGIDRWNVHKEIEETMLFNQCMYTIERDLVGIVHEMNTYLHIYIQNINDSTTDMYVLYNSPTYSTYMNNQLI